MDISFVLLTWNSEEYIGKCLDSIFADLNERRFSFEIFIVDNGFQYSTIQIIKSFNDKHPGRIIPNYLRKNTGTTLSRNLALKKTSGDVIVVVDSDVEVLPGLIEQLTNSLTNSEQACIVVPRLNYPGGRLQKSTDVFPTLFTKIFRHFFLKIVKKAGHLPARKRMWPVDYAIPAMWVMKLELWGTVGLLDENIFYAPEDVDYCLRTWKESYSILYNSEVKCIHHTLEISRGFRLNAATINHILGLFYYFKKHRYLFSRPKDFKVRNQCR